MAGSAGRDVVRERFDDFASRANSNLARRASFSDDIRAPDERVILGVGVAPVRVIVKNQPRDQGAASRAVVDAQFAQHKRKVLSFARFLALLALTITFGVAATLLFDTHR